MVNYTNPPYKLHQNTVKINGYEVTQYNEHNFLKVFHQNSQSCYFKNRVDANYSLEK